MNGLIKTLNLQFLCFNPTLSIRRKANDNDNWEDIWVTLVPHRECEQRMGGDGCQIQWIESNWLQVTYKPISDGPLYSLLPATAVYIVYRQGRPKTENRIVKFIWWPDWCLFSQILVPHNEMQFTTRSKAPWCHMMFFSI